MGLFPNAGRSPGEAHWRTLGEEFCAFRQRLSRSRNRVDYLVRFLLTEDLNRCRPHVSLRGEREKKLGHSIITSALCMDDEVIGSYGEIAGLDINAKFFAQLLGGRSALRDFLNSPDALVGEIAEQHVSGHVNPPSKKSSGLLPSPYGGLCHKNHKKESAR